MSDERIYKTGIMNYYGEIELRVINGKYYLCLDDCVYDIEPREVSEEFAIAFCKEFVKDDS